MSCHASGASHGATGGLDRSQGKRLGGFRIRPYRPAASVRQPLQGGVSLELAMPLAVSHKRAEEEASQLLVGLGKRKRVTVGDSVTGALPSILPRAADGHDWAPKSPRGQPRASAWHQGLHMEVPRRGENTPGS